MGAVVMCTGKLLFVLISIAHTVHSVIIQPANGELVVNLNSSAVVTCIAEAGELSNFLTLTFDGLEVTGLDRFINSSTISNGLSFTFGPVTETDNGLVFECDSGSNKANTTLQVNYAATCASAQIPIQVNLEETPIRLALNISGNPDVMTIKCTFDGGSELPGDTIDISDNTALMWDRADFTIININARTVQVTCTVRNNQGECSSPLRLSVNYGDAPCGDVSGCLATVVVVVLVVGIALAVGITVAVVVVVKKMFLN